MAFERNDIVNKTRLAGELGEELMGFEHNDIVTVDVMNKAIEEDGGGGGDFSTAKVTIVPKESAESFGIMSCSDESGDYNTSAFQFEYEGNTVYCSNAEAIGTALEAMLIYSGDSVDVIPALGNNVDSVSGDAVYDSETKRITITGDCTITGWVDK